MSSDLHLKTVIDTSDHIPLPCLCSALQHPQCVCANLVLRGNSIGDEGASKIAESLVSNKSLVSLYLERNSIGAEGASKIAESLVSNKSLVSLDLGWNSIGDEGASKIAESLVSNKSLVSLYLGGNSIGDEGASKIAESLVSNKSLVSLYLGGNSIGAEGASKIAESLVSNKSLVSLYLGWNSIGDEGASKIAESLVSNKSLVSLYLGCNSIGDEGASKIAESLVSNKSLVSLYLGRNRIGDEGASKIAESLVSNKSLVSLYLGRNRIGAEGASKIAESLVSNKSLVSLYLGGNSIGDEGASKITDSLNKNRLSQRCGSNHFVWFTWLINPVVGALLLVEGPSDLSSVIVDTVAYFPIQCGFHIYLIPTAHKPLPPNPNLFDSTIELLDSKNCIPCSVPSPVAIANGKRYFNHHFCLPTQGPTFSNSSVSEIISVVSSMLHQEFPQQLQTVSPFPHTTNNSLRKTSDPISTTTEMCEDTQNSSCVRPRNRLGTRNAIAEGHDCSSLCRLDHISTLIKTVKSAFLQETQVQRDDIKLLLFWERFSSCVDFSCTRAIEIGDLDIMSAQIIGVGCNGTTSKVMLKPTSDWHIPRKIMEQGVALKMMFNLVVQPGGIGTTEHQRNRFDREYISLIQNTHWGVANILSFFRSYTQEVLIPRDRKMYLVSSETGNPLNRGADDQDRVSIYDRTTFITQELGSTTLEKHVQTTVVTVRPQQQPRHHTTSRAANHASPSRAAPTVVLPLGRDQTLESTFQLLATVDHLNNKRGLFHLDIKSDNILLLERSGFTGQFTVLCDFGTSVNINPSGSGGIAPGMLQLGPNEAPGGNLINRAPESLRPVALTPRSSTYDVSKTDLWAIGCVVWQMCFGTSAFTSEAAITSKPISIPPELGRDCPCLHQLLARVFDRNPATRPSARLAAAFVGTHLFLPGLASHLNNQPPPSLPSSSPTSTSTSTSRSSSTPTATPASCSASSSSTSRSTAAAFSTSTTTAAAAATSTVSSTTTTTSSAEQRSQEEVFVECQIQELKGRTTVSSTTTTTSSAEQRSQEEVFVECQIQELKGRTCRELDALVGDGQHEVSCPIPVQSRPATLGAPTTLAQLEPPQLPQLDQRDTVEDGGSDFPQQQQQQHPRQQQIPESQSGSSAPQNSQQQLQETRQQQQMQLQPMSVAEMNCPGKYMRMSINAIPNTPQLASVIPLGCIIHPLVPNEEVPVVNFGAGRVVRCRICRAYINPFVTWLDHGHRWKCNLCDFTNDVFSEYYCPIIPSLGIRKDAKERPELSTGCYEILAPAEYMVRPPQPPVFFFVIDASYASISSGMFATCVKTISTFVDNYRGNVRTQIGFITFNNTVHFYNLKASLSQPQMLVVPDIETITPPLPDELLVNLSEHAVCVKQLLEKLPRMFTSSKQVGCAFGPAVLSAFNVIKAVGGKVLAFISGLPSHGEGKLKSRESSNTGNDVPTPASGVDFYKDLALECSRHQVSLDLFSTAQYSDLATIGTLPKITGGQVYCYPQFSAKFSSHKLSGDLLHNLQRHTALEAVMRLRCSRGLTVSGYFGNFFIRSNDLLALPAIDDCKAIAFQLSVSEPVNMQFSYLQYALLYTTTNGERRIRVSTLCLPVVDQPQQIFKYIDTEALVNMIAKIALEKTATTKLNDTREAIVRKLIDILVSYRATLSPSEAPPLQLMIPDTLNNLPLYILALVKNIVFRGGEIKPDERIYNLMALRTMPVEESGICIHPRLYSITNIPPDVGLALDDGLVTLPPPLALSCESLQPRGVMLLDTVMGLLIWFGRATPSSVIEMLFGVSSMTEVDFTIGSLPELDNPYSQRVRSIITYIQHSHSWPQWLYICRETDDQDRRLFHSFLVGDRNHNSLPYGEFVVQLQKLVLKG
ncbi:transport protein Sec24 [Pelomyxa schiedti]|nr:transport protein Sec24 [Pelomyxa schiedti]